MKKYNVLRIDSSARYIESVTRELTDKFINKMSDTGVLGALTIRDTAVGFDFVSEEWIEANFTNEHERNERQKEVLYVSDQLVAEIATADILVIGVPIYNFGLPAALKAWIDLIVRVRKTVMYTHRGPVGLLKGKKAFILAASGGTEVDGRADYAVAYMKHVLCFIGIVDVEIIAADGLTIDAKASLDKANAHICSYFHAKVA